MSYTYARDCFHCRTAEETAGEEDEGVCSAAAADNTAIHFFENAQAEEKRLQINEFLAAVLSSAALTQAAQDEVLIFLQM